MTASTIWSHLAPHGNPLAKLRAMDGASSSSGSTSSTTDPNATISANDFLTLLVTEMQNQDPTNATDPNEYINQLVSVNSLEQLIQINQTLSAAMYAGQETTPGISGSTSGDETRAKTQPPPSSAQPLAGPDASFHGHRRPSAVPVISGNLGAPSPNPAARRIAQALSGTDPH